MPAWEQQGLVGNSGIKTELERQIRREGGKMSSSACILMGKEQLWVPTEEVGMPEEGEVPAGVEAGQEEVGMGCGRWISLGAQGKSNLDGRMWERII